MEYGCVRVADPTSPPISNQRHREVLERTHTPMMSTRLFAVAVLAATVITAPVHATTPCPSTVIFEPDASGASVDAGWTGISHGMPVNGYAFRMDVSCAAGSPPCGTCTITGLAPNA